MTKLSCIESYIDKNKNHYGCFVIEPLEVGQAITLGNSLRRTLLSDLTGFAITSAKINNIRHEFAIVESFREDVLEILLNLKEIVFKESFLAKENDSMLKLHGFLAIKGPGVITAGMLQLPKNMLKVINPNQYICTILNESNIYIEVDIENGKGYRINEDKKYRTNIAKISESTASELLIDAIFMPIKKVNYKVKLTHDSFGNIKESLILEVITNGSITSKRAVQESLKILLHLFCSLFCNLKFIEPTSGLSKIVFQATINK